MTSRDGRQQWGGELTIETVEAIRASEEANWKIVDEAVRNYLGINGLSSKQSFERRIRDLEREEEKLEDEIEAKEERLKRVKSQKEDVKESYNQFLEDKESYASRISEILEDLSSNPTTNIYGYREKLKEAAKMEYGNVSEAAIETVIEDVRAKCNEMDIVVRPDQFTKNISQSGGVLADGGGVDEFNALMEDDNE